MHRRTFVSLLTVGAGGLLAAATAVPVLGRLVAPLRKRAGQGDAEWFPLGPVESFPEGSPRRVSFPVTTVDGWTSRTDMQSAWVRRDGPESVTVFTSICPHLGCSVAWKEPRSCFVCPCHDSEFAADGARRHGPARRGLDPLPSRISGGVLEIRWEEFAAGTEARTPLLGGGEA